MDRSPPDSRSKRKHPSSSPSDRPVKQMRPQPDNTLTLAHTNGSDYATPNGADTSNMDIDEPKSLSRVPTTAEPPEWQATIEKVVKNVVAIHFCQTCSFDTDPAMSSEATGFVVDVERGYILTNRHVVGPGPFWGHCIFDNHEECDVHPVYRDPVHDFGILRFDPKAVKYMTLTSLQLRPDLARVGAEIRVVGNDAGEKLSILSGVISRLDRNAPDYGDGYCDFNTNYIQAAASASGGSSGSPVVNIDGFAVALQAGGRSDGAATDYFLPLDRPLRALKAIQEGIHISRGTIQTQWMIKPFDECRRLGLTAETEALVRGKFPSETGMLVAEVVLPEGPADTKVSEGDILVKVNGELLTQFIRLDDILDSSVGEIVKLVVQRGGEDIEVEISVADLHGITPDRFVTVTGASFHDLSYQQARLFAISTKNQGVYVCESAGSFRFDGSESGWLVQQVDDKDTPDLDTFIKVMTEIPDRKRIVVAYKHLRDLHSLNTHIITVDRHWAAKMRMAVRNDKTGLWDFTDLAAALPPAPHTPKRAEFVKINNEKYPKAVDIIRSFVRVTTSMPIKLDGFPRTRKTGHGLVIDAEKGLVVVSRAIVPYDLCDITVTIADSIIVDGEVVFLHPLQNYTIIKYDPSLVDAPVQTAKLSTEYIKQGDDTIFFGFNHNYRPVVAKTVVTDITTVGIPASLATPRYRGTTLDAITVDTGLAAQCGSGVLVSEDGTVQALWMSYLGERSVTTGKDMEYKVGYAVPMMLPIVAQIRKGIKPELRIMPVETQTIQMSQARIMGVEESWLERIERENPERHQLFMVRKVDSGYQGPLQESDIILTLNDKLITRVVDFNVQYDSAILNTRIVRKKQELSLEVPTVTTADLETHRAVVFCGAILHRPHHAVRQQISKVHSDVYVSGRVRGSPAYAYGLAPTNFITHVNGVSTPDLDAFLLETRKIPDNTYFRLKVMTFDNVPWVATMKKCEHYFPTMEFIKDENGDKATAGWRRIVLEADKGGADGLMGEESVDVGGEGDIVEQEHGFGKE